MSNPSKQKGTAHETAIVRHVNDKGLPAARVTLHGANDHGDIHIRDGQGDLHVIEAKCTPNRLDLPGALTELAKEKENAGAMFGAVVFKRKGTTDVGRYYAVMEFDDYLALLPEAGF